MWHFQFQTQESPGQTRVAGSCYFPLIRFKQHGITSVMGQRARLPGLPCSEEGGGQMPLPLPLVSLAGVERPTPMAGLPAGASESLRRGECGLSVSTNLTQMNIISTTVGKNALEEME